MTKIYLILLLVAANLPYITFEVVFRKNARAYQLYIAAVSAAPSSELVDPNRRRGCHFRATSHPSIYFGMESGGCRLSSRHLLTFAKTLFLRFLPWEIFSHYFVQLYIALTRITLQPSLWQSCPLFDFCRTQHVRRNELGFGPPGPLSEFELPTVLPAGSKSWPTRFSEIRFF